jgi:hypothetical protein
LSLAIPVALAMRLASAIAISLFIGPKTLLCGLALVLASVPFLVYYAQSAAR